MTKIVIILNAGADHNMITLDGNSIINGISIKDFTANDLSVILNNKFITIIKDDDYSVLKNHIVNTSSIVRISYY
ncbi:hypothetical protein [Mycoplasma sp. P36-A1]|uniref:hypothetical protein n=1 Tax=Mycoplasma sp. P36-A1 TaxID=3252900 RepID=UPI003C30CC5A